MLTIYVKVTRTIMAETEILDQVDENGKVIGQAPRSVFHSSPNMIHAVVHCWLFSNKGNILWQQRSMQKVTSPWKWDMSCGGHILSGHNPETTLKRELEEELGLTDIEVKFIEKYIHGNDTQTELIYLYYGIIDETTEFRLQKDEVEKVEWIKPSVAQQKVLDGERDSTDFIFREVTRILEYLLRTE